MFGNEPFGKDTIFPVDEKFLDINEFVKNSINNKVFVKLIREFLIICREKQNKQRNRKEKSFPKGTLIFVRDLRPKMHKKVKPVFFKTPQKVVSEYKCTVYAVDFLGKVSKHSKNNVKIATERSVKLFGSLPDDIKLVLGEVFNTEQWD